MVNQGVSLCVALVAMWVIANIPPQTLSRVALPLYAAGVVLLVGVALFGVVVAALLIAVPAYLVKRQPDLGTGLLLTAAGFYVLFLAGLSWKVIVVLGAVAAAAGPTIWSH